MTTRPATFGRTSEVSITDVRIDDPFWNGWIERNCTVTLAHQHEKLFESGRVENLLIAAGRSDAAYTGMFFNDSDIYKWLEAACNSFASQADESLRRKIDDLVEIIAAAQRADGYLNSYFTVVEPDKRWTNLGMMHELYCAGHLFQAAVAHFDATGTRTLLDIACHFADHIDQRFRVEGRHGAPGHEEIELALIQLAQCTGSRRYAELAELFIRRRGTDASGFRAEIERLDRIAGAEFAADVENFEPTTVPDFYRSFFQAADGSYDGSYAQDHCPVCAQSAPEGHAVRAMYLYIAMTMLADRNDDAELRTALRRIWDSMTGRRMYISGGIGANRAVEGFGPDYHLPNDSAYAETCAAVGSVLWNHRMALLFGEARFMDVAELTLYNAFLAGVSLSGDRFFYVNPIESDGHHRRADWFNVPCCPMNASRLLASIGRLIYAAGADELVVNLFVSSTVTHTFEAGPSITLSQRSRFPWEGSIRLTVEALSAADVGRDVDCELAVTVRIPGWCRGPAVSLNGEQIVLDGNFSDAGREAGSGYLSIRRRWRPGDTVELSLPLPVERVLAHPAVREDRGKMALMRGPVLYCVEQCDVEVPLEHLYFGVREQDPRPVFKQDLLGGCVVLESTADASLPESWNGLYERAARLTWCQTAFRAVPYHLWANREPGKMAVWLAGEPRTKEVMWSNISQSV